MTEVETIDQAVRRHSADRPEVPAFVDPQRLVTWAELDAAADRCAGQLRELGVGRGDRVAWLGPNAPAYATMVIGAWRVGASVVGLNFRLPPSELAAITEAIGVAHAVVDARFAAMAEHLTARGTTVVERSEVWPPLDQPAIAEPVVWDDEDEAMIYFTSGSTGHPKAVPLTRSAVEATMLSADVHEFTTDSKALIIPPAFHAAGATWTNYCLHNGATVVYTDDASPAGIARTINEHQITHAILVPTLIHSLVEELKRNPQPLPSLHHVAYGASPITQHLLGEALEILGCDFCQVYGLSEGGGAIAFLPPEDHVGDNPAHLSSAGRPCIGVEVEVRDFSGAVLGTGESGELWFRAPTLTRGYIGNQEATGRVLIDGWLNTRDVGFVDADGYIYVEGRSDDMIQSGAENVHPQAVEEVVITLPGVQECAVYGTPDPHWGQRVTAAIVADRDISESEVIEWCKARLAAYQVPKVVVVLSELPRTATGKVQRKVLAGMAEPAPAG
ncbi:AMP-binding protein [Gordonia sp. CPCC 206044]|uniref:class I adenylate-forming enzyme family protein n=1 Tax=Gordonia sp. CPCC 206044 TaxID=3140793 RepID=UPI003AF3F297